MPVHSVESIVCIFSGDVNAIADGNCVQLLSVISLLSSDKPNLDSPANVDAAKEVRTDFECKHLNYALVHDIDHGIVVRSLQEEGTATGPQKC